MLIRQARLEDAAAVAEIQNRVIRETTISFASTERSVAEVAEVIAGRRMMVAEEDGIMGYASWFQFRTNDGYRHTAEHSIALRDEAMGRGAGRALIEAVAVAARSEGFHTLWAGISAENPAGVAFHAAVGFEHSAVLPEVGYKFGRWLDLILMVRRL